MISRAQYTAEELHENEHMLPGFNNWGDVIDIFAEPNISYSSYRWQPVLSATIVTRLESELHVLTGKRTGEGNETHINVASTPTLRLPSESAGLHTATFTNGKFNLHGVVDPRRPFVSGSVEPCTVNIPDTTDILAANIGYLLALKLKLADTLEIARSPIGRVSIARFVAGFSGVGENKQGEPLFEPLIMFGAIVGLTPEAAQQIPAETVSYGRLGWAPIDSYVRGVMSQSVIDVIPTADPSEELEVCVRGLCNATSLGILSSEDEIQWQLSNAGLIEGI